MKALLCSTSCVLCVTARSISTINMEQESRDVCVTLAPIVSRHRVDTNVCTLQVHVLHNLSLTPCLRSDMIKERREEATLTLNVDLPGFTEPNRALRRLVNGRVNGRSCPNNPSICYSIGPSSRMVRIPRLIKKKSVPPPAACLKQ